MERAVATGSVTGAGGVRLAVFDLGGGGPPALLSHATGFHGRVWAPLAAELAGDVHAVALDHRGHGASASPAGLELAWERFADDLLAVADGLGLERPLGIGHSMGATALLLAEAARPGTFRGLWCFEPVVVPADPPLGWDPDSWLAAAARRRRSLFASREEARAAYSAKPPLNRLAPAVLAAYVEHGFADLPGGGVGLACRPEVEAGIDEWATAHGCWARLPAVGCPVLLACGARTDASGPRELERIAARLPRARVEVVAGVGHLGPLEEPAAAAGSIRRWLAGISGGGVTGPRTPTGGTSP